MTTPRIRRYLRHGSLTQLAAFEAVVTCGSVTRAAEALHLAQPTLSGHLRKLSDALGVPLFSQQGKRLVPTDSALVLLQAAREVFAVLDRCEAVLAVRRVQQQSADGFATRAADSAVINPVLEPAPRALPPHTPREVAPVP